MNSKITSVSVKDVNQGELVVAIAAFLKKSGKLKVPEWVDLVKTGVHKELAPYDPDWYYTRCASVARYVYLQSPIGACDLTRMYGGRINRGVRPSHYKRASSSCARKALQSLEALKWIEKDPNNGGRRLTPAGCRDMDRLAAQVRKETRIKENKEALALQTQ